MKQRILIVDDNRMNLKTLVDTLKSSERNWEIRIAQNGESALERAIDEIDLILLDVMMPGINGFEVCQRLQADPKTDNIPVIFMTALDDTDDIVTGFEVGGVDYITKPFEVKEVLARVNTHLRMSQYRHRLEDLVAERTEQLAEANEELEKANAELQKANRQLQETLSKLEKLDSTKSDFISIAGHELRTPLSVVTGYAGMLRPMIKQIFDEELPPEIVTAIKGIENGCERLKIIMRKVLDAAAVMGDRLHLEPAPVDLVTQISPWVDKHQPLAVSREIQLEASTRTDGEPLMVEADPIALEKALANLVVNAIKYTPDGGEVAVDVRQVDHRVQIDVADTGIGISPDHQSLIFEPLSRGEEDVAFHSSGDDKFKGAGPGLGLTIAKGIVVAHGGRIWVESPGRDEKTYPGSVFSILLPLADNTA